MQASRILGCLVPGVRERRVEPSDSNEPINKRLLLDLYHELERVVEVMSVEGRARYGIRRNATEDSETDERVLNHQTGHRSSETRREVYHEKEREEGDGNGKTPAIYAEPPASADAGGSGETA